MKTREQQVQIFRLEDRDLFEAAAAAVLTEAADAVNDQINEQAEQSGNAEENSEQNASENDGSTEAGANTEAQGSSAPEDVTEVMPDAAELEGVAGSEIADELTQDGDGAESAVDFVDAPVADELQTLPETENAESSTDTMTIDLMGSTETLSTDKELVVINSSVMELDKVVAELDVNQDVLILDAESEEAGLAQLQSYLDGNDTKYSAIHFVTHGNEGHIVLNGAELNAENFDAEAWSRIGEHLTENGDILIYGCDLTANAEGELFCQKIAEATGADVAASDDTTGFGGDWELEYRIGNVDTESICVESFNTRLANWSVIVGTDDDSTGDGATNDLREAVYLSQDGDSITISPNISKITLKAQITIDKNLTISGNGVEITVVRPGTANRAPLSHRIFEITADSVTLKNMTVTGGYIRENGGAIYIHSTGEQNVILENVTVQSGYAANGGGIAFDSHADSKLQIIDSTITGNATTANGKGAGLYAVSGQVIIDNSTLSGQTVKTANADTNGGAIYAESDAVIKISGSKLTDNLGRTNGGAIYNNGGTVQIEDSVLTGNTTIVSGQNTVVYGCKSS